ncbi:MAG: fructosamine kinase family protein [Bacteroidia bacterium]
MFRKEAEGLDILKKSGALIPEVINILQDEKYQYLLLSWLPPTGETPESSYNAGIMLAQMHKTENNLFGLEYDNYMGSLPQKNDFHTNFSDFWANCRIIPLIEQCRNSDLLSGNDTKKIELVLGQTNNLIPQKKPSLIHGDLWSGNFHPSGGIIYLIDPAVAYSHLEADLAMMHLFGSPSSELMRSYENEYPPEPGFRQRFSFFNIYPLLVHLLLFGHSYHSQLMQNVRKYS